jgi:ATP-dependent RNA helicase DeaD
MNSITETENIVPALGAALSRRGYEALTPVQQAVLGESLGDADLLVSAQTGSGKTVAFGLAIAPTLLAGTERFAAADTPLALVVAPTRELALQVKRELEWLYADTGAAIASCVGGMDMREERRVLQRGAHIVVGTPGRLRDHIERHSFITTGLRAVVLDEADEMLDLGFREDLEFILGAAPTDRRTLMFSATVPSSIATLARRYQRDAVRVSTSAEKSQHVDIEYRALTVAPKDRENAIINVLRFFEAKNALVFCATRATVNRMTARLNNRGFSVVALSGELSQNERTHALQAMRDGRARVCVATDVAARGIDLPNLELVIHADIPKTPETLLHRSGRTGRAGRKGVCALIVANSERRRTERLLDTAKITASWARPPSVDEVVERDRERILEDPMLSEPITPEELVFAQTLLDRHGGEQVAAAFLRLHAAGHSAPEELLDAPLPERPAGRQDRPDRGDRGARDERPERKEKRRDDFTGGVWFSLSVGFRQNAEARWLLPMLCRFGKLTKQEVGAIKVQQDETHVELAPQAVDRFLEAIGPGRVVEGSIIATALAGAPQSSAPAAPAAVLERPAAPRPEKPRFEKPRNEAPRIETTPARTPHAETPAPATPDRPKAVRQHRDEPAKPFRKRQTGSDGARPPFRKKDKSGYDPLPPAAERSRAVSNTENSTPAVEKKPRETLKFGAKYAPKTASKPTPKSPRKAGAPDKRGGGGSAAKGSGRPSPGGAPLRRKKDRK